MQSPHSECDEPLHIDINGKAWKCTRHLVGPHVNAHSRERWPEADINPAYVTFDVTDQFSNSIPAHWYREYWTGFMVGCWVGALIIMCVAELVRRTI